MKAVTSSTPTLDLGSSKISNYSVALSIAAHVLVIIAVKVANITPAPVAVEEQQYIDLGYQTFDEVPEMKPVVRETEEIQDQTSEIQSLKKEQPKVDAPVAPVAPRQTYADVPYYKIKPKYPADALAAGIEGNVKMSIEVLEDGSVGNIKVTGGEKLSVFETVAMRAVAKYKYKPFTDENGNPIKKADHVVLVEFKIKEEIVQN